MRLFTPDKQDTSKNILGGGAQVFRGRLDKEFSEWEEVLEWIHGKQVF